MKRLYDTEKLFLNEAGEEFYGLMRERVGFLIKEWLELDFNRHDIERISMTAINTEILYHRYLTIKAKTTRNNKSFDV